MESDLIKRNLCSLCALAILAIFAVGSVDSNMSPSSRPAKTQSDPVAEYWKQFDRGSYQGSSHAEIAANLSAREAAARAKVASQTEIRRDEYRATVPHAVTKAWIAGIRTDKIGVDLLVERGITDRQLADLIRWYVGCNTTVVTVYDDAENARKRENMLASYMCGDANDCTQFERFAYPKGKDWTVRSISFTEKTATPEIRKAKPVLPPPSRGSSEPDRFTEKTGTKSTTKRTPVSDAAVIAHADATAAEVTAAAVADPLHDHFPKPDPVFFNSLSDRQMELWEKEFKQRRLQQMQRQRP
jgi:hypothetical protein